jgi:hypothetical protein
MSRLDELEEQVSMMHSNLSGQIGLSGSCLFWSQSMSSLPMLEPISPEKEMSIDEFAAQYHENAETAVLSLVTQIRTQLATRVPTRRLIEKSNAQYVDTSFQRVSTRLTALVNQKVTARHYQLESELSSVIAEIDGLRDHVVHELADIRAIIQDCKSTMEKIRHVNEPALHGTQTKGRMVPRKGILRRPIAPLLRARSSVQADAIEVSLELKAIKPI